MKELSVEEKAKRYDEAIKRVDNIKTGKCETTFMFTEGLFEYVFPELKEGEDERIKEWLINLVKGHIEWLEDRIREQLSNGQVYGDELVKAKNSLAWVEKQGEQNNNEDADILQRFSFYSYKDEPNVLYLSSVFVNEEYRNRGIGTKILEVTDEVAKSLNCHTIRLKTKKDSNAERLYRTHGYNNLTTEDSDEIWLEKQGEQKSADNDIKEALRTEYEKGRADAIAKMQKPAWSEEDKTMVEDIIEAIDTQYAVTDYNEMVNWLKSLKDRYTWKPSDEQMQYLSWIVNVKLGNGVVEQEVSKHLNELLEDLKKLKG